MTYVIEKDIPLPPKPTEKGKSKYPLAQLQVGESFSLPLSGVGRKSRKNGNQQDRSVMNVACAISNYYRLKNDGRRFAIRTMKEHGVVRVWRIA